MYVHATGKGTMTTTTAYVVVVVPADRKRYNKDYSSSILLVDYL